MSKIIYTQSNGIIAVIHPISGNADDAIKDVPDGVSYEIVEDSVIPTDRTFRDAWVQDSKTIKTDMAKAKELHRDKIREERQPLLDALDIEFQKALETSADTTSIVSKKKALRDAPANTAIDAAKTESELKAAWDTAILGTSPYN